tara:strand:- start:785 stop:2170 length:1386 start_codon:yes stop_codon:yes gene_type:complete
MDMNIESVEKAEIFPLNNPSNNTYSFKQGHGTITFDVASQAKLLRPSSLRLNGTLKVVRADGTTLPDNQGLKNNNAGAHQIQLNDRIGVNSVIQNIAINSASTGQTIEQVRNYGKMISTLLATTHSSDDYASNQSAVALMTAVQQSSDNLINNEVKFSIPFYAGVMNSGKALPLGTNGMRGLQFVIELASDQQVLKGANAADGGGASYQLKNVSLSYDLLVPDAAGQEKMMVAGSGSFEYNSYNSLYSVINASDNTQTFNLAANNVLSVVHNFLPTTHSNNYAHDGFANPPLTKGAAYGTRCVLDKVNFSRGGLKLGLDYELSVQTQSTENRPPTQVEVNAINAVRPFYTAQHLLNQPLLQAFGAKDSRLYSDRLQVLSAVDSVGTNGGGVDFTADPSVSRNFAIGLALDNVSKEGVSFKGVSYAVRIRSDLDGASPNAVYTYALVKNQLVYSPQGIAVVS